MPTYTLYYFNGRGRAEICRLLFAAASIHYNDERIEFSEWTQFKTKMPCHMLPVLEIDTDMKVPQSMAISRYLAREFGFYGKNNMEMFKVDSICDSIFELFNDYMVMFNEKDTAKKKTRSFHLCNEWKRRQKDSLFLQLSRCNVVSGLFNDYMVMFNEKDTTKKNDLQQRFVYTSSRVLPYLEKTLEANKGGSGWFVGDQMLVCDMMCYSALENPVKENPNFLKDYPKVTALRTRVSSHPKIAAYIKKRNNTAF